MKATIEINMDNAAFESGEGDIELARILASLANKLNNGVRPINLWDSNGNIVGSLTISES